jgi:hypothetical protein
VQIYLDTPGRLMLNTHLNLNARGRSWLCETLGIGQPTASNWCSGRYRPPPEYRLALWVLLGIPEEAWLTDQEWGVVQRAEGRKGDVRRRIPARPSLAA